MPVPDVVGELAGYGAPDPGDQIVDGRLRVGQRLLGFGQARVIETEPESGLRRGWRVMGTRGVIETEPESGLRRGWRAMGTSGVDLTGAGRVGAPRKALRDEREVRDDVGQRRVDLVGDAGGQRAERGHPLALAERALG